MLSLPSLLRSGVAQHARAMSSVTSVTFTRHGNPGAVLSVSTSSMDDAVSGSSVLVRMLAAPISPNDFSQIRGYGARKEAGSVAGNEGVGVVEKVGSNVKGLSSGDLVVPARAGLGTWTTHTFADEDSLFKVGSSSDSSFPVEAAATLAAPATAIRLVDAFASLKSGDVIIQNNAGSTVGQAVVQYAASKGIKTINIMRHRADWDDVVTHLKSLGAETVVTDEFAATADFAKLVADLPGAKLGLNSTGGAAATAVARALGNGASFVTYGNMSGKPLYVPLDVLVSKDVTVKGFNLDSYLSSAPEADRNALLSSAMDMSASGKVKLLLAVEPFKDVEAALRRSLEPGERKVVLKF